MPSAEPTVSSEIAEVLSETLAADLQTRRTVAAISKTQA